MSWKKVLDQSGDLASGHHSPLTQFEYLTTAGHVMAGDNQDGRITVELGTDRVKDLISRLLFIYKIVAFFQSTLVIALAKKSDIGEYLCEVSSNPPATLRHEVSVIGKDSEQITTTAVPQ